MPREITTHKVNGLNEALRIFALDERGSGNASHLYEIGYGAHDELSSTNPTVIKFQSGSLAEVGINGISNESLLAIVEDRLAGFQAGGFACTDNSLALGAVRRAIEYLHQRTLDRVERGVEGTSQK